MNGDLRDYQKLFDAIAVMVFVITWEGEILAFNKMVTQRLEYAKEELIGQPVFRLHPKGTESEVVEVLKALSIKDESICNIPLVTKSGGSIEVETKIYKGTWEGEPVLFGFSSDLGPQKILERKFEAVFFHSPIPIMVSRLSDGMIYDVNGAWCNMMGYTREEVLNKSTIGLNIWIDLEERIKLIQKLQECSDIHGYPIKLKNRTNQLIYGFISGSQICIDGESLWITSLVNHTEEYLLQQELSSMRKLLISSAIEELDEQFSGNKYIKFGEIV